MISLLLLLTAHAGPLADAVAAGDCDTVITQTDVFEKQAEKWRVPRGWCLLKLNRAEEAVSVLSEPIQGVLAEYGTLIRARALLALGKDEEAEKALAGLRLPGKAGTEILVTRAELFANRGDISSLRKLKGLPAAQRGYLEGLAVERSGDAAGAAEIWKRVWLAAEVGGWDTRAAKKLGSFTTAERTQRLTALRKNGRIDEAAALADELSDSGGSPLQLAKVNLQARHYQAALTHWKQALGEPEQAAGSPSTLFDYALTYARTGDYDTAAVIYNRLITQHQSSKKASFASYKLGYMAYDKSDCGRAVPLFESFTKSYPESRHVDEALWFTARCHWRGGDVDAAVAMWARIAREYPRSSLASGAAYWRARAKGVKGEEAAERDALNDVIKRWPTSGYAWFAAARVGRSFPVQPLATAPAWPKDLATRTDVKRAEALLDVGFRDWARAELAPVAKVVSGKEASLAAAWAFLAAGDYRQAKKLARPYCVSPWKKGDPVAQQACTPRVEATIVDAVAEHFDLNPLVPYGIMTAESALKPGVTSVAGARGLMQLMPKEGPRIHRELYPNRTYDPDDLYSAPYNASMGTAELGLKRQSLKDVLQITDLPAVIASYNGGEEAVRRWLSASEGTPDFDEFSEDIGYTETRKYVKRVLGFVMRYRWVYGDR